MASLNIMPVYTDAYLADTIHLSTEEHGAYMLLLIAMWRNGGFLPANPERTRRVCKVTQKRWENIWKTLQAFITEEDGKYVQKKLVDVYARAEMRARTAKANGERGGRKKSSNNNETKNQSGSISQNQTATEQQPDAKLSIIHEPLSDEGKDRAAALRLEFCRAINVDRDDPEWVGCGYWLEHLLSRGFTRETILAAAAKVMSGRRGRPPNQNYFTKAIETENEERSAPAKTERNDGNTGKSVHAAIARLDDKLREFNEPAPVFDIGPIPPELDRARQLRDGTGAHPLRAIPKG